MGCVPAAASLEVTAGASSSEIISETPGARCEIYARPGAPRGLIHTQILRIDALNTVDVPSVINDIVSPRTLFEEEEGGGERIFRVTSC